MKTAENIKKVALVFFLVLGLTHLLSGLLVSNNYFLPTSLIVNRTLDIPFAMTALMYGISTLYGYLPEGKHKIADIAAIGITLLVFIGLLYINIFVQDKPPLNIS